MLQSMRKYAIFAAVLMMAAPQLSFAQSAAPLSGLYACEALTTQEAQVACFLSEIAKLRAAENSGDIAAMEKQRLGQIQDQELNAAKRERAQLKAVEAELAQMKKAEEIRKNPPKSRTLAIVSAAPYGANGYIRFTLENGEVWRQIETGKVRLGKSDSPDTLTLKKRSLGSYLGRVNDRRPSFRISQVK